MKAEREIFQLLIDSPNICSCQGRAGQSWKASTPSWSPMRVGTRLLALFYVTSQVSY